ncbi:hypothetical protein PL321_11555 [Caloramator sp. mosi_1]|uniref:hypothetical protein n=1 Tax=Caloramator sp. mosi_1 TaxID=3023090 RepID=UPI0023614866|nr:hypothetical protein [Caloramator sp. mosi_1]WDC83383.1 hypothetical protein PL321_11555 [Caloramator sp. mosi_1]
MKNHINELFDSFTPKEEQKANILHKIMNERERRTSINSKYFYGWRGFLRPAIACLFCLLIAICVFAFREE